MGNTNVYWSAGHNKLLSNLAPRPFRYGGIRYHSVEHAYQTLKSGVFCPETYLEYSRGGIKIPGKLPRGPRYRHLMYRLMRDSFDQNSYHRVLLLRTSGTRITHIQDTGVWRSLFPFLLMKIRNDLEEVI